MSGPDKELKQLLDLLLDQQCDENQHEQIEKLLAENPTLNDQYIEQLRLHSMLQWHCDVVPALVPEVEQVLSPDPIPDSTNRNYSKLRVAAVWILSMAAVLLVAVGLASFWFHDSSSNVGWASSTAGVIWDDEQNAIAVGESFDSGQIRTKGGRLELQFKSGATLQCYGPSEIDILTGMHVRVAQGKISVRIAESAKGFVVETPDAQVVDLGTEFGVQVRNGEHTDVVVFDGEVDVERKMKKVEIEDPQRLTKGEAVRVDKRGELQRIMQVNRESKTNSWTVGESESGSTVIRSIRDNLREPDDRKYYEIVPGGFEDDALAYADRLHQWNGLTDDGLPEFLRGGDYVRTFNSDKSQSELEIRLTLACPATLYVLYDNRCPEPTWLSESFTDTNVDVGKDNVPRGKRGIQQSDVGPGKSIDNVASVWKLVVDEPGEVVLGQVEKRGPRGARAMYGIVAVPQNVRHP